MKKTIYLLSICILFQSCFTYKNFNLKDYEIQKPKKVKIELKDSRKLKGTIKAIETDKMLLETKNEIIEIEISSILKSKYKKFSFLKTGLAVLVTSIALKLIAVIIVIGI